MPPKLVVLGAGVSGLTSAVDLLEAGWPVTVVAHRMAPEITSSVAAGLWYPYAAAGSQIPSLAIATLRRYQRLISESDSGVRLLPCVSLERSENRLPFWRSEAVEFEPIDGGFRSVLPLADSGLFLNWLARRIESLGGTIERVSDPIQAFEMLDADVVVNCTGLGSGPLCNDDRMMPIKGTVVIVENPGIDHCITDDRVDALPTYLIPTAAGLVLGGCAERGNWNTSSDPSMVDDIIDRCSALEPALDPTVARSTIRAIKSGLRPGRDELRLESETTATGRRIVHNYGHGGSGYTLCWGCAEEVVRLVSS